MSSSIVTALGAYGHFADVERVEDTKCDICKEAKRGIAIDTSMGEYATLVICKDCTIKLFEDDTNEKDI